MPNNIFKFKVTPSILGCGLIQLETTANGELLSRAVMDTKEKAIREALIALGWTPPPEPMTVSHEWVNPEGKSCSPTPPEENTEPGGCPLCMGYPVEIRRKCPHAMRYTPSTCRVCGGETKDGVAIPDANTPEGYAHYVGHAPLSTVSKCVACGHSFTKAQPLVPLWREGGFPFPIFNHSEKFFVPSEIAKIISFVSDRVDDQITRLEITQAGEVIVFSQDGKKVFYLIAIFPK